MRRFLTLVGVLASLCQLALVPAVSAEPLTVAVPGGQVIVSTGRGQLGVMECSSGYSCEVSPHGPDPVLDVEVVDGAGRPSARATLGTVGLLCCRTPEVAYVGGSGLTAVYPDGSFFRCETVAVLTRESGVWHLSARLEASSNGGSAAAGMRCAEAPYLASIVHAELAGQPEQAARARMTECVEVVVAWRDGSASTARLDIKVQDGCSGSVLFAGTAYTLCRAGSSGPTGCRDV